MSPLPIRSSPPTVLQLVDFIMARVKKTFGIEEKEEIPEDQLGDDNEGAGDEKK